jgi:hypothetical protein
LILDFLMTHETKVCLEKRFPLLIHIQGIWMHGLCPDIFVAVLTRRLAVGRDMKPPGINQPGSVRFPRKSQEKTSQREGCKCSFHESSLDALGMKAFPTPCNLQSGPGGSTISPRFTPGEKWRKGVDKEFDRLVIW